MTQNLHSNSDSKNNLIASIQSMLQPLGDRILIHVEQKKSTSIILQESSKEKPTVGKILAIGPAIDKSKGLEIGSIVVFSKYTGTELDLNDLNQIYPDGDVKELIKSNDKFIIMKEADLMVSVKQKSSKI